ncbi:MAG: transglutaminase domain-containing protein [Clostridiales bacterium]|nr:transglutaminase domain-containing protein [Clostridiales bacterium]
MKKFNVKRTIIYSVMGVIGICAGAATFFLSYFNTQSDKILPSVTIETGTPIVFESFLKEPVESSRFITDVSGIDTNVPGSYQLTVGFWRFRKTVILNVVDTTAPTAEAVPQTIYCDRLPAASSVVTDVYDLAPVTIEYVTEPDVSQGGEYVFQVSVKDASGNEKIVDVPFTVVDDHTAPLIYGAHDLEGFVGMNQSYLDGITVTDNYDPNPVLVVDNSQVNTNISSSFPVTYIATDENGNSSSVTVTLTLRVKPDRYYDPEIVYDMARRAIEQNNIYDEDMTDVQKAFRIFNWVHNNIHYIGTSDKSDWTVGAFDGFSTHQGDCFTYYACCRAMLDVAGIPNLLVERYPITWSPHYWNLVQLDGQWYHCDACYAYYHEGYYFMYAYNDLNHSDHGYDVDAYGPEINIAQDSVQQYVNYNTLEVEGF